MRSTQATTATHRAGRTRRRLTLAVALAGAVGIMAAGAPLAGAAQNTSAKWCDARGTVCRAITGAKSWITVEEYRTDRSARTARLCVTTPSRPRVTCHTARFHNTHGGSAARLRLPPEPGRFTLAAPGRTLRIALRRTEAKCRGGGGIQPFTAFNLSCSAARPVVVQAQRLLDDPPGWEFVTGAGCERVIMRSRDAHLWAKRQAAGSVIIVATLPGICRS